jgi:hypothetical protein
MAGRELETDAIDKIYYAFSHYSWAEVGKGEKFPYTIINYILNYSKENVDMNKFLIEAIPLCYTVW